MSGEPNLWLRQSHERHPELYDAEYAKQLDRIARIRTTISASIPPPDEEPPPVEPALPRLPRTAPLRWDEAPPDFASAPPPPPRPVVAAPPAPAPRQELPPPKPERRGWAPPDHSLPLADDRDDPRPPRRPRRRVRTAAALVLALAAGITAILLLARDPEAPVVGTTFRLAGEPTGIAVSGTRVWVAGPAAGSVWILDAATGRPAAPALKTGGTPARLALTERWAWIADTQRGAILRAATDGNPLIRTLPGGPDVTDVVVAADAVWSASSADGTVRVRGPRGATRVLRVGSRPLALAADERWVVAADAGAGALIRLSATSRRVAAPPVRLGGTPVDVALVGAFAWVVDSAAGTVQTVNVEFGVAGPPVKLCTSPVAVAADQVDVYVLCRGDRTLVRLDPSTGRVRARDRLAHPPTALALDPRHVWIAAGDHEVIRVDR